MTKQLGEPTACCKPTPPPSSESTHCRHMSEEIRNRTASTTTTTTTAADDDVWKDQRTNKEWAVSFAAMMVPFLGFCYGHSRGATGRAVEAVVRSPVGVYGLLALPFCTLAVEKCIYDTVQAAQGIDPNVRPKDRGGFPSGGAELPSFSLIAVRR